MKTRPIDEIFAQTTINPQSVKQYLRAQPGYLQICILSKANEHLQDVGNSADFFEYHLRRYLMGKAKTLHRVFHEVRAFMALDEHKAGIMIILIMRNNEEKLLQQEWYECIPHLNHARGQLKRKFLI